MKLGSETINRKINLVENCAINISFIFCQRQQQGELNSAVRQTTWGYSFHPSYPILTLIQMSLVSPVNALILARQGQYR